MRNGFSRKILLLSGIVLLIYATVISNKYYIDKTILIRSERQSSTKIEELEEVLRLLQKSEIDTASVFEEKLKSLEQRQSEAIAKFYEDLARLESDEIASNSAIEKIRNDFAVRFDNLAVGNAPSEGEKIDNEIELPAGKISGAPVRKWDGNEKIVFLHIGKAGGTSFDGMMGKALKGRQSYVGGLHFDWSYIMDRYPTGEVVTMLREPVSRAVSHFNFMKKLSWTKGMAIRSETIDQFLDDIPSMMNNRGCWQDGQAAVSWFTGTHVGNWVKKRKKRGNERREARKKIIQLPAGAARNSRQNRWDVLVRNFGRSGPLIGTFKFPVELATKLSHAAKVKLEQGAECQAITGVD